MIGKLSIKMEVMRPLGHPGEFRVGHVVLFARDKVTLDVARELVEDFRSQNAVEVCATWTEEPIIIS